MTAPALPEDVEKAIQAHAYAAAQWPTGAAVLRFASNRLRAAILAAMRAATAGSGAASHAAGASARALGGDGEPVAGSASFGVVDCHGGLYADSRDVAEGRVAVLNRSDIAGKPYRVVPLYLRPAAPGDTGEGDGALIGEAFDLIGHIVNHARRSTNIDGTRRRLGDDEACGRNWIALVDKCEALLAARAATGGPDARCTPFATRPAATGAEVERAVAEERAACAQVLNQMGDDDMASDREIAKWERAIEAIRARGAKT